MRTMGQALKQWSGELARLAEEYGLRADELDDEGRKRLGWIMEDMQSCLGAHYDPR